ncbi:hypothetical protein LOTGIDRAFT_221356 [Lottia gigantea]|uniref:4-coumarate--CoA ligase n=1 Tax=Lottia gigantea TaxID=225164 RepID=V3ZLX6_LOTGI|nr:hypothetical protein LOTGIDRAFT_221356 [Lottia gigantea]ESO85322.1 hypothetical protein LOTGIDRAFT_221356 [Lottia gigantea]
MAYPNGTFTEYMFGYFDKYSKNVALVELDTDRRVTYGDLKTLVIKAAHGFRDLGVQQGDVVCIFSTNNIDYAVAFFALTSFGATLQATNPLYTTGELQTQFVQCNTRYVITLPPFVDKIKEASTKSIKKIIVIGASPEGCVSFDSLVKSSKDGLKLPKADFDPKKTVACLLFSSGTTGLPKAVMLTQYNLIANLVQLRSMKILEDDSVLVFLPFFHLYGLVAILSSALTCGSKMVLVSRFQPVPFMEAIQKHQIKVLHLVPPVMVLLAKLPETKNYDLTCVRKVVCGAAPLSINIECEVKEIFKIPYVSQGYGMTEVMVTHLDTEENHKAHSVGQPLEGIKQKIINPETGKDVAVNVDGEVCIKGEQIMLGYLNQPEVTAAMMTADGWARTGDVGHVDEDGYLFIVDRIKELIKYKGHQVAPAELEALLLKHPSIADVGVIGVPDSDAGELPKAYVVLKKDQKLSEKDIVNYVAERVAPHKKLRGGVEFLEQIPKSASGKILRRVLRDRLKK